MNGHPDRIELYKLFYTYFMHRHDDSNIHFAKRSYEKLTEQYGGEIIDFIIAIVDILYAVEGRPHQFASTLKNHIEEAEKSSHEGDPIR